MRLLKVWRRRGPQVVAGELSPQRADLIRHNVLLLGAQARVRVLCADFWHSICQVEVRAAGLLLI